MIHPLVRCAISDRNLTAGDDWTYLLRQATRLANEGVNFFQIREKDLAAGDLVKLTRALLECVRDSPTKVLVNSRADVAVAAGADGVHLTSNPEELTPAQARQLYTEAGLPLPLVTVSCHTIQDVRRHRSESVDAILFGPVFEKVAFGKCLHDGVGLASLRDACVAAGPVPVFALGGVTTANLASCMEAGARGVAGIRIFQ